jgi:dTDP-L-rhamnose 4-epimerase
MKGRALVTSGAGFIGSFLTEQLLGAGYEVRVFDNLTSQFHPGNKRPSYLTNECELVVGDVRDIDALEKALKGVDSVVHLAARVGVGQSQYEIQSYSDVNIGGTASLLDLWVNQYRDKIRKLVIASSMSIYAEGSYHCSGCTFDSFTARKEEQLNAHRWEPQCPKCGKELIPIPTPEDRMLRGASVYALTKRVQEELSLSVCRTYQLPVTAFRFFNVFGPRQSLSNPYTGVLSIFLSRIKNKRPPIIYEDGLQTRDFISVHDVARIVFWHSKLPR